MNTLNLCYLKSLLFYVARVRVRILYPIRCGCNDMKVFKNLEYRCSYIYNKLLYKNKIKRQKAI
jgi:hypothetical protein